jgi:nicotinate-nucleotide adenylyltransferase
MKKLCVFGGSFDPPHVGHEMIIKELLEMDFDRILIMPNNDVEYKQLTSSVMNRSNMVKILVDKYDNRIEFSDLEIVRDGITKTCDTIKELKNIYPDYQVYFAVGSDSVNSLPTWDEFEYLRDNTIFVVANRGNVVIPKGVNYVLINNEINDISSSYIRENLDPKFLDDKVYQYVLTNKLYQ